MTQPDYRLDLDRSRPETLRAQAARAIAHAIRRRRPGFDLGDHLTTQLLARANPIHRNTLRHAMDDLVLQGYLRRLPNKGFQIIDRSPERPAQLTRHMLSLTQVAERSHLLTRSIVLENETGTRAARQLTGSLARVRKDLSLAPAEVVAVLTRRREVRRPPARAWHLAALEQSILPLRHTPDFFDVALQQIRQEGDFSLYRYLRRTYPRDDFFKAQYEISLAPLPAALAGYWDSPSLPMSVVNVTFASVGAIEWTHTWFDSRRAVLLAGSLDVRVV
ncbi:MAG: hypothetical protein AB1449_12010 [Chloroflexota bacterium]